MVFDRFLKTNNDRSLLVKRNIIGTFLVKGISVPTQLLLVPLTIGYISSELYGIWLTLTSIIGWIGFFDIGFGNGLRNRLAEALANNDLAKAKKYISTTYVCLTAIFVTVGCIAYFIIPLFDWTTILNTSGIYKETIETVLRIVVVCFCLQMIISVQSSTWRALQKNAVASFVNAMGQVVTLVGIWILTITTFPSLKIMAIVYNGSSLLVMILSTIYLFVLKYPDLCPSLKDVEFSYAKNIVNLGGKFFIIQIAALVTFQFTNIILSNTCGPESVTEYNVIYKYMSIAYMVMDMIVSPIWSAFTDAYTKNDKVWMLNTYRRLQRIFLFVAAGVFVMVLLYPIVFKLWLGNTVTIHTDFVIIIAIYVIALMWSSIHSSIINGIGKLKFSLLYYNIQTVINIPVCYFLGQAIGAKGVILGIILVTFPNMFTQPYQTIHLIKGDAKGIWNK